MPSFKSIVPPGPSEEWSIAYHYAQAIDLGNGFVKISGQGGWDEKGEIASDPQKEVELTIKNVDDVFKAAGLRGWEDVYYVRSYHLDIDATLPFVGEALKKRIPGHRPGCTATGVTRLALPTMKLEIEVDAKKHTE
ncbi:endoribonuclease l-psp family [Fusarium albosuccineum]|uniref:Endoribonuclease l-psp family n=1 Tax=Fusarium albosuccineum TaxID=1237068 RepID=A0A8H4P074_9HYPO|nr:endoribonuclease l-psp family [Fusarium albosuccineum]